MIYLLPCNKDIASLQLAVHRIKYTHLSKKLVSPRSLSITVKTTNWSLSVTFKTTDILLQGIPEPRNRQMLWHQLS